MKYLTIEEFLAQNSISIPLMSKHPIWRIADGISHKSNIEVKLLYGRITSYREDILIETMNIFNIINKN